MTNLATFIQDSAYPGKALYMEDNQLHVEGAGVVPVARVRELDTVGQLQWESEDKRQLAFSVTRTNLAVFAHDSAYPDKALYMDQSQLYIEGAGAVSVARVRELDTVGQLQWQNEEMRRLAYSLEPAPQPAPQPQSPAQEPAEKSGAGVFGTIIIIVVIIALAVLGYFVFQNLSAESPTEDPPASQTEPQQEEPEQEEQPEAPEPDEPEPEEPSDETT